MIVKKHGESEAIEEEEKALLTKENKDEADVEWRKLYSHLIKLVIVIECSYYCQLLMKMVQQGSKSVNHEFEQSVFSS